MTEVHLAAGSAATAGSDLAPRRSLHDRLVDVLPGLVVVSLVVGGLRAVDTPALDIVRYSLYLLLAVLLPGLLVHRALRGRPSMLLVDWALGAATGTGLSLAGWALFMALGIQRAAWLWPLLVFVPFAVVPGLRQHWKLTGYTERSRVTSWLLATAMLYYSAVTVAAMRTQSLPPHANEYYVDTYWHLSNAAELTRRLPPNSPEVAGSIFRYPWFPNADMAQAHLVSGIDLPTILLRLWLLPVVAIVLGLLVVLCQQLVGRTWPAGIAAFLVVAPAGLMPWHWFEAAGPPAFVGGSPSANYGLIPTLFAATLLADVLHRRLRWRAWPLLVMAAVVGVGSKPSAVPILLAGLMLVGAVRIVRRGRVTEVVVALAVLGGALLALSPLVAQPTAASGVKLFGLLAFAKPWTAYASHVDLPATGGLLLAGLGHGAALALALALVGAILLQLVWVGAGVGLLGRSRPVEPVAVFLSGAFLGAMAATLVIDHAGQSEIYFEKNVLPLAAVLAAWGLAAAVQRGVEAAGARRTVRFVGLGVAIGVVGQQVVRFVARAPQPPRSGIPRAVLVPVLVAAALPVAGVVVWWVARRLGALPLRGLGATVACAALIAAGLVQGPMDQARYVHTLVFGPTPRPGPLAVSADETAAAVWVSRHTPPDAIIATNVHCRTVTASYCDARAFWVTAFTERRAVVESWAYTEQSLERVGQFKTGFPLFPFYDPALLTLNDRAFTEPTATGLTALRAQHGATWLFADTRAGRVSDALDALADLRYSRGTVRVFELRK